MTQELITADEARQKVSQAVNDKLTKAAVRDITREIQKKAEMGLREVQVFAPATSNSRKNQERTAAWTRAARAALIGAGFDVQPNNSGAGAFIVVRW